MELGEKGDATIFSTVPSKTLDHHRQDTIIRPQAMSRKDSYPDREADPDPDPHPTPISTSPPSPRPQPTAAKKANRKSRTRGELPARYRECQKNHAAAAGGQVVDGCCEFMPGGREGTPEALKCAACECHRNFHRKEMDGQDSSTWHFYDHTTSKNRTTPALCYSSYNILHSHAVHPMAEIARKSSSSEGINNRFHQNYHRDHFSRSNIVQKSENGLKKKRFRTKISQEQKEKMKEFAEKLGWRLQKKDEEEIGKFCSQVNLKRQVFKVWMHNNKQAMKRSNNLEK